MHRMQFKRAFDLCLTIPGLIIFTPVMLLLAILVRWRLGSPVIFRQERPGYQGQPFIIYKFRTMREAYDRQGRPLPDHLRISRLGRFLRSTSLDELPEFSKKSLEVLRQPVADQCLIGNGLHRRHLFNSLNLERIHLNRDILQVSPPFAR